MHCTFSVPRPVQRAYPADKLTISRGFCLASPTCATRCRGRSRVPRSQADDSYPQAVLRGNQWHDLQLGFRDTRCRLKDYLPAADRLPPFAVDSGFSRDAALRRRLTNSTNSAAKVISVPIFVSASSSCNIMSKGPVYDDRTFSQTARHEI